MNANRSLVDVVCTPQRLVKAGRGSASPLCLPQRLMKSSMSAVTIFERLIKFGRSSQRLGKPVRGLVGEVSVPIESRVGW